MNCLCCGKPLRPPVPSCCWHPSCVKRFFGTADFPELELTNETLALLADQTVNHGYTVPGVQKKLSLHLSREGQSRLTLVDYPTGYILKPQVQEYTALPESEHLIMLMAEAAGLSVVPHGLIPMAGGYAYFTRRIDRMITPDSPEILLAMEDFCQLSLRLTQDKYKGSYEQCARVVRNYSMRPRLDLSELFLRLVFCFLTGNSDMHLKNFSLVETQAGSGEYILSPAYDLLPVNIIMPEDPEELALQLNGKKSNLRKKNFLAFAENAGIAQKAAEAMIRDQLKNLPKWKIMCEESLLPGKMKQELSDLMSSRATRLE